MWATIKGGVGATSFLFHPIVTVPQAIETGALVYRDCVGSRVFDCLFNLHLTYNLTDGEEGLMADDLKRAFYGDRKNTKLASKIDGGSMKQFLPLPGDKEKIWYPLDSGDPKI